MDYLFGFCYYLTENSVTSPWSKDCAQGDVRILQKQLPENAISSYVKKDTYKELIWKKKTCLCTTICHRRDVKIKPGS